MRIRIAHETTYNYATPAKGVIQTLRLSPRNHEGQQVIDWRIDISADCKLDQDVDAFGNITHTFTADGPIETISVAVDGTVDTHDTQGIVRGAIERFPPTLFLRETPLTHADEALVAFAAELRAATGSDNLKFLHELLSRVNRDMTFDADPTHAATTATQAWTLKRGVCQDFTHIFVAAARSAQVPARYISGYYCRSDIADQEAGHAWAEAWVDNLGWLGFDPTHGICPIESHIRVAAGLDYLSAAPVRGTRYGGADESLAVKIRIEQAKSQAQN